MDFEVFNKLMLIDLSSNSLTQFPLQLKDCKKLKILRLTFNEIPNIPSEFLASRRI